MKIITCMKLIANPDIIEFDVANEKLCTLQPIVDPIDCHVLEEGLLLRENHGGEVIALSVAPDKGEEILRKALLSGADRAIRLWNDELKRADTYLYAQVIKEGIEKIGFDLILCGARSSDHGNEFMVSTLAQCLDIPSATQIIGLAIDKNKSLTVHKKLQKGRRETYRLELPAILGLEPGINEPRYVAPFSRIYRDGMNKKVEFLKSGELRVEQLISTVRYTQAQPRVKVGIDISGLSMEEKLKMMRGELSCRKEIFEGSPESAAQKIFSQLEEFLT
jgi:electron transfer flavoprotein beta subunit